MLYSFGSKSSIFKLGWEGFEEKRDNCFVAFVFRLCLAIFFEMAGLRGKIITVCKAFF